MNLNLSSNVFGNSNDETSFPLKFLLTDTQINLLRKAFANGSSDNMKLLKLQLSTMVQLGLFVLLLPLTNPVNLESLLLKTIKDSLVQEFNNKENPPKTLLRQGLMSWLKY